MGVERHTFIGTIIDLPRQRGGISRRQMPLMERAIQ
jgi:hypothetical protein